jgi:hypothetical protein
MDNNFDDIFNEDFDFKPITEGLGFHEKKDFQTEKKSDLAKQSLELKRDLETAERKLNSHASELDLGELAPFYGQPVARPSIPAKQEIENIEAPVAMIEAKDNASVFIRFFAWTLDFVVVGLTFLATLSLIVVGSGVTFEFMMKPQVLEMFLLNTLPIYLMIYLFYFSFLDKTTLSTVGKNLLNLRVVTYEDTKIRYTTSLLRSFIQLLGLLTLGFSNLLDIPGKMTRTKVVNL